MYDILFEGPQNGSNKVTKDDLDSWTQEFTQTYPVVMGDGSIQQRIWAGYDMNGVIGLPVNLVIDRKTMVVKGKLGSPTFQAASALCDQ